MQKRDLGLLVFLLSLILSFAGCATTNDARSVNSTTQEGRGATTSTLAPTAQVRFNDLPAPVGFKLIQEQSFVFQTEETRVALLKYSGRAKLPDLVNFYKEQMLLCNWDLQNIVEYDKSILNFNREKESCLITIESQGMRKIVTVALAPKAKRSIETSTKSK